MLDQLEAGITALRSRNRELETNPTAAAPKSKRTSKNKKKSTKATAAKKKRDTIVPISDEAIPVPATGKRQALGRSILQLRRPAASSSAGQ